MELVLQYACLPEIAIFHECVIIVHNKENIFDRKFKDFRTERGKIRLIYGKFGTVSKE